jgi:hypothetical protein
VAFRAFSGVVVSRPEVVVVVSMRVRWCCNNDERCMATTIQAVLSVHACMHA